MSKKQTVDLSASLRNIDKEPASLEKCAEMLLFWDVIEGALVTTIDDLHKEHPDCDGRCIALKHYHALAVRAKYDIGVVLGVIVRGLEAEGINTVVTVDHDYTSPEYLAQLDEAFGQLFTATKVFDEEVVDTEPPPVKDPNALN